MADARDFLYTSDYPPDYIIAGPKRNYTLTSGGFGTSSLDVIPHELPFAPLVDGVWGFSSNLSDARTIADTHAPRLTGIADLIIEVSSDETNIYIYCSNFEFPTSTRTFYFDLWMYINPSYTDEVMPSSDTTDFRLNTDYRYMKLYDAKNVSIGAGVTEPISHPLGFEPRVLAWIRADSPFTVNNTFQIIPATITATGIYIQNIESSTRTASYRIYAND